MCQRAAELGKGGRKPWLPEAYLSMAHFLGSHLKRNLLNSYSYIQQTCFFCIAPLSVCGAWVPYLSKEHSCAHNY